MGNRKHGHSWTVNGKRVVSSEYKSWQAMKARCLRPDYKPEYFGMAIDEVWKFSFEQFLMDMGPKPSASHTIDRINGTQGYFPDNCRWATKMEQGRNRIDNAFPGKSVEEAAKEAGVSVQMVRGRIAKGWPREMWLDPKAVHKIRRFSEEEKSYILGSDKTTNEIAEELGVKSGSVFYLRKYSEAAKNG